MQLATSNTAYPCISIIAVMCHQFSTIVRYANQIKNQIIKRSTASDEYIGKCHEDCLTESGAKTHCIGRQVVV